MKTLREVLLALRRGDSLPLDWRRDQWGEKTITKKLSFRKGEWLLWEVACWNSSDYGFGTCGCVSHSPTCEDPVSRGEALDLIKAYMVECNQTEARKVAEINWLDRMILDLEKKEIAYV